ncbi:hypothetical protein Fot_24448 [Forsythia ovata]|uniref:Uncharacterized protein n=1 Tax=Forsythia ovata TaxID=205694 RepID=A0ABD1U6A0_9LAMI
MNEVTLGRGKALGKTYPPITKAKFYRIHRSERHDKEESPTDIPNKRKGGDPTKLNGLLFTAVTVDRLPSSSVFAAGVSSPPLSPLHTIRFDRHRHRRQATQLHSRRH